MSAITLAGALLLYFDWKKTLVGDAPPVLLFAAAAIGSNYFVHGSWKTPYAHRGDGPVILRFNSLHSDFQEDSLGDNLRLGAKEKGIEFSEEATIAPRPTGGFVVWDPVTQNRFAVRKFQGGERFEYELREWDNWYEYEGSYWLPGKKKGVDLGEPSIARYAFHCLLGHYGILSLTPFWVCSILGAGIWLSGSSREQARARCGDRAGYARVPNFLHLPSAGGSELWRCGVRVSLGVLDDSRVALARDSGRDLAFQVDIRPRTTAGSRRGVGVFRLDELRQSLDAFVGLPDGRRARVDCGFHFLSIVGARICGKGFFMKAQDVFKTTLKITNMAMQSYLSDLTDADLLTRPGEGCNHIAWQLGHLISSNTQMLEGVAPGMAPKLPEGFDKTYSKEMTGVNDAAKFHTKQQYLDMFAAIDAATLAALDKTSEADLDKPAPGVFAGMVSHGGRCVCADCVALADACGPVGTRAAETGEAGRDLVP